MLCRSVGEERGGEVLDKSVVEKCRRRVLKRCVEEEFCADALEECGGEG